MKQCIECQRSNGTFCIEHEHTMLNSADKSLEDCAHGWNLEVFHNQSDCKYTTCMGCDKVLYFQWKSLWKRIINIFK
jgi:hypothetical protein